MLSPNVPDLVAAPASPLRNVLERFSEDADLVSRRHGLAGAPEGLAFHRAFCRDWLAQLDAIPFDTLDRNGQIDYLLLARRLQLRLNQLDCDEHIARETAPLLPFAAQIVALHESRMRLDVPDGRAAADALDAIQRAAMCATTALAAKQPPCLATVWRAVKRAERLKTVLDEWFTYFSGYDPSFSWWTATPYDKAMKSIDAYVKALRCDVLGEKDDAAAEQPVFGAPLGDEALRREFAGELIAYAPEELLAIGEREFAWCEEQLARAAGEMGCADWHAALERVKNDHVEPGKQPSLVRDLAIEAMEYVEQHGLMTVPPLVREAWRIVMIKPEQQKFNPFFWGGETIGVSFAHSAMTHTEKLMSMRGNNIHFARATVHHELVPGHHLQMFMGDRYNRHRNGYGTAFCGEGWPLYWEMMLWDMGFAQSPANKIGMLFWRMHRAARVMFSIGFHLGRMTPQHCIDLLVDRVGHERNNAIAEVRRSLNSDHAHLYQCAYLLGGLQLRALRHELVDSGTMTSRAFHDAVLEANSMPIELLRALLADRPLTRDYQASWRFAG